MSPAPKEPFHSEGEGSPCRRGRAKPFRRGYPHAG